MTISYVDLPRLSCTFTKIVRAGALALCEESERGGLIQLRQETALGEPYYPPHYLRGRSLRRWIQTLRSSV